MKEVGHGKFVFVLDESSIVNNVKKLSMHDTPQSTVGDSFVCRLGGLKWKENHTTLVPLS